MDGSADARLQRLLGGDHLVSLRKRLRRHYERAQSNEAHAVFRIGHISRQEYETLASLMGRPSRYSNSIQVDVGAIDTTLRRADIAPSLRLALERLDGPIVHLATARADTQSRWSAVAAGCRHSKLAKYLQKPMGLGLLKRLTKQDSEAAIHLRERADAVLHRLPADGLPRAQLAAETLGDAHALDTGQATAALVLAVWRQHDETSDLDDPAVPQDTLGEERARDVWARAGVLVNELARPVLFLNMLTHDGESLAPSSGEPSYASLRMLLRSPPAWAAAGRNVYICENPNLLAIAADRLGAHCSPLVCTEGMPAAAQHTMLTQLAKAGARLLYHGDFDWPGVRIANYVIRTYGAEPWRFGSADYATAVSSSPHQGNRLSGTPTTASWDALLAPAMQAQGLGIPEEGVAASLLRDLQQ
jgi:uncharacterized protein (TIGR02679 family)